MGSAVANSYQASTRDKSKSNRDIRQYSTVHGRRVAAVELDTGAGLGCDRWPDRLRNDATWKRRSRRRDRHSYLRVPFNGCTGAGRCDASVADIAAYVAKCPVA